MAVLRTELEAFATRVADEFDTVRGEISSSGGGSPGLPAVKVASTTNLTLSGTQTIDGVAVAAADTVLAMHQNNPAQNGIYTVAAGAWSRHTSYDSAAELAGVAVRVSQGTLFGGTQWVTSFDSADTVGTTAMWWSRVDHPTIVQDEDRLQELEEATKADIERLNQSIYTRALAAESTIQTENWASLSGWRTAAGSPPSVSGGKMYGGNGALREISLAAGKRFTARCLVNHTATAGGTIWFGVSGRSTASDPVVPDPDCVVIGMTGTTEMILRGANMNASMGPSIGAGSALSAGQYYLTVTIDDTWVSLTLQAVNATSDHQVRHYRHRRSDFAGGPTIRNLTVGTTGTNASATGNYISSMVWWEELGQPPTHQTVNSVQLWGGTGRPLMHFTEDTTTSIRWAMRLPSAYSPYVPCPVVEWMHYGLTGDATEPWTDSEMFSQTDALDTNGYIMLTSDNGTTETGGGDSDKLGDPNSIADYTALVDWARQQVSTGPLFLLGASAGGHAVQNMIAKRTLGGIAAGYSINPSTDFMAVADDATYTAAVFSAWGVSTRDQLLAASNTWRANDHEPRVMRGVPQRFVRASGDVTTPPSVHVDPLVTKYTGWLREVSTLTVAGTHLPPAAYDTTDLINFFEKYRYDYEFDKPVAPIKIPVEAKALLVNASPTLYGTQTVDGISLSIGDICAVSSGTALTGVYYVQRGLWTRHPEFISFSTMQTHLRIQQGTTYGGKTVQAKPKSTDTIGTTSWTWNVIRDEGDRATAKANVSEYRAAGGGAWPARANDSALTYHWIGTVPAPTEVTPPATNGMWPGDIFFAVDEDPF